MAPERIRTPPRNELGFRHPTFWVRFLLISNELEDFAEPARSGSAEWTRGGVVFQGGLAGAPGSQPLASNQRCLTAKRQVVAQGGLEPPTPQFSVECSTS